MSKPLNLTNIRRPKLSKLNLKHFKTTKYNKKTENFLKILRNGISYYVIYHRKSFLEGKNCQSDNFDRYKKSNSNNCGQ